MKRVYFGGAFDIINAGHIRAFKDAKAQGDYLIVGLNTDELIKDYKEREPIMPYEQRKEILEAIKYIDEIVPMTTFSPLQFLMDNNIDVFVIYIGWKGTKSKEMDYMKAKGGGIFFTPEYDASIHSSIIKKRIVEQYLDNGRDK